MFVRINCEEAFVLRKLGFVWDKATERMFGQCKWWFFDHFIAADVEWHIINC